MKPTFISWSKAFEPIPQSFETKLDCTLQNLQEEQKMKRRISRPLVAAIILLLIVGSALAASTYGLLDSFKQFTGLIPDESAQMSISQNVASFSNSKALVSVREAVYDGATLRMLISVESVDPEHTIIIDADDEGFSKIGEETVSEYAQRTHKEIVNIGFLDVSVEGSDVNSSTFTSSREGETMLIYTEQSLTETGSDKIKVNCIYLNDTDETDAPMTEDIQEDDCIAFDFLLNRTGWEITHYTADQSPDDPFIVFSAAHEKTPFATYFSVDFSSANGLKQYLRSVSDLDAICYGTAKGNFFHTDSNCSGMQNALSMTVDEAISSGKAACPICVSGTNSFLKWGFRVSSEAADGNTLVWDGARASLEGSAHVDIAVSGRTHIDDISIKHYVFTFQNGTLPDGNLLLTPIAPDGTEYEPILLSIAP